MTAEVRRPVRLGAYAVYPLPDEPDIYAGVRKVRALRWRWHLTAGLAGPRIYGPFYAWTERGAWAKAHAAAGQVGS